MLRSAFLAALLAVAPFTAAQEPKPHERAIEAYVRAHVDWNVFSGVVLVAKGDEVIFAKAYGMANQEFSVPNRLDTRFRVASINKFFTAIVLARLYAAKKLSPDDAIVKWLPDFPSAGTITVAHLAGHRSGIRDPRSLRGVVSKSLTPDEAIEVISSEPLATAPGETYSYTTANYTLLASIIEKVTGRTYATAMRELLYEPAGMRDSGDVVTTTVIPRLASGYMPNPFGEGLAISGPEDSSWKAAGGSSYTTGADLHRLLRVLYTKKLLGDADPAGVWRIRKIIGRDGVEATGGMPGTSAYMMYLTEDALTVAVLSNNYAGVTGRMGKDIASLYFGEAIEMPPAVPPASSKVDDALLGSYEVPATGWKFDVTLRNGQPLVSYRDSIRQTRVVPRGPDEYFVPMDWSVWRLKRDEGGAITGGTMTFVGDPANPLEFRRRAAE